MTGTLHQSLVRVWDQDDRVVGAGFLVGEREVLTCAHVASLALGQAQQVLPPTGTLQVDFPLLEGEPDRIPAAVSQWIPEESTGKGDIAGLLLHRSPPSGAQPVMLVNAASPWDQQFRTFGFPAGMPGGAWSSGVLRDLEGTGWLQIDATTSTGRRVGQGYSGAPVWVEDEALPGVIGMVVAADKQDRDRVAFVIPTEDLLKAWPAVLGQRSVAACPYRGLSAFRERDADLFFGREEEVTRLADAVRSQPLVAVLGPSGSGKSSLVLAGLMPALRSDEGLRIGSFRPGRDPFGALAVALLSLLDPNLGEASRLEEAAALSRVLCAGRLAAVVERILDKTGARQVLLVADQFEELFTLCTDESERRAFLDAFVSPERIRPGALAVVLTMRADFYAQALGHQGLREALERRKVNLGAMTPAQLKRVIEEPARRQRVALADGLVDRILSDVGEGPGRLPLLEFALTRLWEQQRQGHLPHDGYTAIGRVDGALTQYAERVYQELSAPEQVRVRRVFGHLVALSDGVEATRRVAVRADLVAKDWAIVQRLADYRLVVTDRDPAGQETAQVAHEALIQGWPRLRDWVAADREYLRWREQIRAAVRLWEHSGRDEGDLLRGVRLSEAEHWCAERPEDADERVLELVRASRHAKARELLVRGSSHLHRGLHDEAITCYEQASSICAELGDHDGQVEATRALVELHLEAGQFELALRLYEQTLTLSGSDTDPDETTKLLLQRIAMIPPADHQDRLSWHHRVLTVRQRLAERYQAGLRWYRKALTIHRQVGERRMQALIAEKLAAHYMKMHDVDRGLWFANRAVRSYRELGMRHEQELLLRRLIETHGVRGEWLVAIQRYRELVRLLLPRPRWTSYLRNLSGDMFFASGLGLVCWVVPAFLGVKLVDLIFAHTYSLPGVTIRIDPSSTLPSWFDGMLVIGALALARSVGGGLIRITIATIALFAVLEGWRWLQGMIPFMWGLDLLLDTVLPAMLVRWLLLDSRWSLIQPYTRKVRVVARSIRRNTVDHLAGEAFTEPIATRPSDSALTRA